MGRSCAIIPKAFNNRGEKVDSKLFKDLLSFTSNNRELTIKLYQIIKSADFIRNYNPILKLDTCGEPTLVSLLEKTNIGKYISEQNILKELNKRIGHYKKDMDRPALHIKNDKNYNLLKQKAIEFNTTSEFRDKYVAKVINIEDSESHRIFLGITVEPRNRLNSVEADKMEYNERLNEKLRSLLESYGISIGALTELERRQGINGVTDFDQARNAATGLVELIRLANGIEGEKALPEEFAHFVLEALSDNPLVKRLINNILSNGLASEIIGEDYDTYVTLYHGDDIQLAKEAAGKLLAKHFLQNEAVPAKPYKNILQRFIQAVKNFFKGMNATPIQKAMREADKNFNSLARQILDSNLDDEIKVENITARNKLYNTTLERVTRDKKLLQQIIDNEVKRLHIYEKRSRSKNFGTSQRLFIDNLEFQLLQNAELEGIYSFLDNALDTMQALNKRLLDLENTPGATINEKAKILRRVKDYLNSYESILEEIRKAIIQEERYADNRYEAKSRETLNQVTNLIKDLKVQYQETAMPLFISFIKPWVGEGITVPFGKWKGTTMTAEDLIKTAHEDISFFDRWLDSMADSSDYILKIIDQAVKMSKEKARLSTVELSHEIKAATLELEQAGIKNTDWMFERDDEGNLTGNYISEINTGLYKKRQREMYASLEKKYGKNPVGDDAKKFKTEEKAWYTANTVKAPDGTSKPNPAIYKNKEYTSLNAAQKKYYTKIMEIKSQLDSYLPENYTFLHNTIKIRKDLLERVKSSEGVKSGSMQIWEAVKDQFIRRTDDTAFGDRATLKDFEGREVQTLPIYYTKMKEGENVNDISTDVASTLIAYAAMANDFKEMNRVIDTLELGRDLLRSREIQQTKGNKPLVEKINALGRTIESKVTRSGDETRFMQRLNDYFEMQVYNRYLADEGTFGNTKIDKAKAANFVNRVTSLNMLGLNILSGISNVLTGKVMMRIESFAGEFYSESNTLVADKNYGAALPEFLAEIGNRVKTSKLALWDEYFNVMQEYEQEIKETNFDRKTWFSRMFGTSALFLMNNAGEHWMQNRTSLALADAYKMKAPDGKIVSLWDAMEVVPLDPNNKKLGAKLQVKQGYTKEDGTAFTKEDVIAFSRRTTAINQRMHGIYNELDKSAVQRLAIGRMGIMFRKWIKPSLNRRFKSATYNFDLQGWTEGYYRTTGRFLTQVAKELKEGQFALGANWEKLSKTEKANIKRAATEVGHLLILSAFLALMDWDDDDDRPWLKQMIEYQARRLYTEIGTQVPVPQMINEALKIMKSPAAGVNTLENVSNMVGLLNPYNYETFAGDDALIQSGRYKGDSKAIKLWFESPLIPMNKTIYRGLHPEESIPFFKQ